LKQVGLKSLDLGADKIAFFWASKTALSSGVIRMRATQIKASHLQKRTPRGRISIKPLLNTLFKKPLESSYRRENIFPLIFQTAEKFYFSVEKLADSKFDLTNAHNIKSENLAARCSKEVKQNNTSQILNVDKICFSVTEAKREDILFFLRLLESE